MTLPRPPAPPPTGNPPNRPTGSPRGHHLDRRADALPTGHRPPPDHAPRNPTGRAADHPTGPAPDRSTGYAPPPATADTAGSATHRPTAHPAGPAPVTPTATPPRQPHHHPTTATGDAPPSLFPGVPTPPPRRTAAHRRRSTGKNTATTPETLPQTTDRRPPKRRRARRQAAARPKPPRFPPPPGRDSADEAAEARRTAQARRRIMVGVGLLAVWGALIGGRLVQTQVFHHEAMLRQAAGQHRHGLTIPPFRGEISDRNGRPLAVTVPAESVYASPPDYADLDLREAAAALARCLDRAPAHLERRLRRKSQFSWLRRKASREQAACARESGYPVGILEEYRRAYPAGSQAAHLIGYVGVDGNGLGGAEHALDALIRGEPGRRTVWTDGRRTGHRSRVEEPSRPGADVRLTIDLRAQAIAEEELLRGVEEIGAVGGAVVLLESATGEVLALAGAPTFDPNRYGQFPASALRNQAFTDPYEPGSVFKIVTAAAALEEGVTHEEERFETHDGQVRVGNRTVRDWKPLGPLTFAGVIRRSSNIGTLQVARRLGSRTLHRYIRAFGFGEPTGLGGSGESRGIVPAGGVWRPIRLATVSFGQGIAVTPAQMAQAVNAIANDGVRLPLRLTRALGGEPQPFRPGARVVRPETAARVRALLAGVVAEGTGRNAGVRGFAIAGKTGTAQKAVPGGYSETDYISSFAGFAPAERPLFTAVVILDTRKPNHSGAHAARVFGRIASRLLWRYRRTGRDTPVLVAGAAPAYGGGGAGSGGQYLPVAAVSGVSGDAPGAAGFGSGFGTGLGTGFGTEFGTANPQVAARDAVAAILRSGRPGSREPAPLVAAASPTDRRSTDRSATDRSATDRPPTARSPSAPGPAAGSAPTGDLRVAARTAANAAPLVSPGRRAREGARPNANPAVAAASPGPPATAPSGPGEDPAAPDEAPAAADPAGRPEPGSPLPGSGPPSPPPDPQPEPPRPDRRNRR